MEVGGSGGDRKRDRGRDGFMMWDGCGYVCRDIGNIIREGGGSGIVDWYGDDRDAELAEGGGPITGGIRGGAAGGGGHLAGGGHDA